MVSEPDRDPSDLESILDHMTSLPPSQAEHLLNVAASVTRDAHKAWAEIWREFKPHVSPGGMVAPELEKGFVPSCGWSEFLEKLWLLRHYLDSIDRVCKNKH